MKFNYFFSIILLSIVISSSATRIAIVNTGTSNNEDAQVAVFSGNGASSLSTCTNNNYDNYHAAQVDVNTSSSNSGPSVTIVIPEKLSRFGLVKSNCQSADSAASNSCKVVTGQVITAGSTGNETLVTSSGGTVFSPSSICMGIANELSSYASSYSIAEYADSSPAKVSYCAITFNPTRDLTVKINTDLTGFNCNNISGEPICSFDSTKTIEISEGFTNGPWGYCDSNSISVPYKNMSSDIKGGLLQNTGLSYSDYSPATCMSGFLAKVNNREDIYQLVGPTTGPFQAGWSMNAGLFVFNYLNSLVQTDLTDNNNNINVGTYVPFVIWQNVGNSWKFNTGKDYYIGEKYCGMIRSNIALTTNAFIFDTLGSPLSNQKISLWQSGPVPIGISKSINNKILFSVLSIPQDLSNQTLWKCNVDNNCSQVLGNLNWVEKNSSNNASWDQLCHAFPQALST